MPQAVIGAAIKVGAFIKGLGVVGTIISAVATNIVISAIAKKLFKPDVPAISNAFRGTQVTTRGGLEYRKIGYGQAMASGPVVYNNVSGDENEYLWYVIPIFDHACEDFVSLWLDGQEIPKADIDWTAGTGGADGSGTAEVSTSDWVGANSTSAVSCWYYLGHDDQVVSAALNSAFSDIGTNHRLRGITYIIVRFLYNADTEEIWERGLPQNIKAVFKLRKIYDPRLDSTNGGSGSHRYTDATTWAWSENPWLEIADYLVNYMGAAAASAINWTSFADAADHAEVSVAIPTSSTEDRFTGNGVLSLGETHRDNLQKMLSACDGRLNYSGGTWTARASEAESTSFDIVELDIISIEQIRGSAPESERINSVRGYFADPDRNYALAEFSHVSDATYVTRDNGKTLYADLELPFTNSNTMAQRLAYRLINQANDQRLITLRVGPVGAEIQAGAVGTVTIDELGFSADRYRCIDWQRNPNGSYDVTLKQDTSGAYDDPVEGDYAGASSSSNATPPSAVVPAPSGLSAVSVAYGVKVSWTNPAAHEFDFIDVYESSTSAWSGATKIASVRGTSIHVAHASGAARYYWVRARRNSGDVSNRFPNSDTSTITTTSSGDSTPVQLFGASLSNATSDGTTNAAVSYQLTSAGAEQEAEGAGAGYVTIGTWLLEGAAADYDVRLTVNSGDNPTSGASLSTWLALSTTRTWTLTDSSTAGAALSNNCTVEIRLNSSGAVLVSATVTMFALKTSPL